MGNQRAGDEETIESLSQSLGVDKVIANLLVQRGIQTFDEAKAFFDQVSTICMTRF